MKLFNFFIVFLALFSPLVEGIPTARQVAHAIGNQVQHQYQAHKWKYGGTGVVLLVAAKGIAYSESKRHADDRSDLPDCDDFVNSTIPTSGRCRVRYYPGLLVPSLTFIEPPPPSCPSPLDPSIYPGLAVPRPSEPPHGDFYQNCTPDEMPWDYYIQENITENGHSGTPTVKRYAITFGSLVGKKLKNQWDLIIQLLCMAYLFWAVRHICPAFVALG